MGSPVNLTTLPSPAAEAPEAVGSTAHIERPVPGRLPETWANEHQIASILYYIYIHIIYVYIYIMCIYKIYVYIKLYI